MTCSPATPSYEDARGGRRLRPLVKSARAAEARGAGHGVDRAKEWECYPLPGVNRLRAASGPAHWVLLCSARAPLSHKNCQDGLSFGGPFNFQR
jgi:hypothetical protein